MLVSGRKFDIGTYVVVTSGEPFRYGLEIIDDIIIPKNSTLSTLIRIYLLNEWLLRFCNTDYEPFDPSNAKSYVVGDDYTPIWEVPEISTHYSKGIGMKNAFFYWLKDNGISPTTLESKMALAVGEIWESQQPKIAKILERYNNYPGQFFELLRMDWVVGRITQLF